MHTALALIVLTLANLTGGTCAAMDNGPNVVAFTGTDGAVVSGTYSDMGERLVYRPAPGPVDDEAWMALHAAEEAQAYGTPAHKLTVACR